jgi:hypothetical protein
MPEPSIEDEIRQLAEELATIADEDVRDSADILCRNYRRRAAMIDLIDQVNEMAGGPRSDWEERLRVIREELRQTLQTLLHWAKEAGRMD